VQEGGTAPQAPASAAVRIEAGPTTVAQTIQIPQSAQDIAGLRARRAELVDQLDRTMDRRSELIGESDRAPGGDGVMQQQLMTAMDARIVQLEADIAATERALTSARPELLAVVAQREAAERAERDASRDLGSDKGRVVVFTIVVAFLVLALARRSWRRAPTPPPVSIESAGRLERIEQAVEAMAIEIERVSEGQRFVTKLLSEAKAAPALDNARMQPTTHTGRES
jgi:hypothetical protein